MLKCDFGNLHREIELLESAHAPMLHLDVMDGHFVPNLSYGPMVIERLRELTELPFEAHLMISDPTRYADDYLKAGCNLLTFHLEAVPEPRPLIEHIHSKGACAGLAINPKTPVERLEPLLNAADLFLVMSVEPGFGGQKFIPVGFGQTPLASFAGAAYDVAVRGRWNRTRDGRRNGRSGGHRICGRKRHFRSVERRRRRLRPGHSGINRAGADPSRAALIQSQRNVCQTWS